MHQNTTIIAPYLYKTKKNRTSIKKLCYITDNIDILTPESINGGYYDHSIRGTLRKV